MTRTPRVADYRANRAAVAQWKRVIVAARADLLSPAATAYVLSHPGDPMKTDRFGIHTDDRGVRYVGPHRPAPRFSDGTGLFAEPVTCGHCHRTWDNGLVTSVTPTPSARCPFEHWHR